MRLTPIILAGGSGARLWPRSRELYPKQFLRLTSPTDSLLQCTIKRLSGIEHEQPLVVCHEEHRFLAAEQLREAGIAAPKLLLEPEPRNTAAAIAIAAIHAQAQNQDPLLLVLPADHLIQNEAEFCRVVVQAIAAAEQGLLVTFGIEPTHAETGFGYLQMGEAFAPECWWVKRFQEKPDSATAQAMIAAGGHVWNSGMFLFRASAFLAELKRWAPAIHEACFAAMANVTEDGAFVRPNAEAFKQAPQAAVDTAVMEHTKCAVMTPLLAGWSDVGSWSAVYDLFPKDAHHNQTRGDVLLQNTHGSMIHAESRLVAALDIDNLLIVETKDAVLVTHRDSAQRVKMLVEQLSAQHRTEHQIHPEVFRPWGRYERIHAEPRYQVKRIVLNSGERISLQMHHYRSEHWVVVRGKAWVSCGEQQFELCENESTFIPLGAIHRLENRESSELEIIEVQTGSYLGEDDIVRFDDKYGRDGL